MGEVEPGEQGGGEVGKTIAPLYLLFSSKSGESVTRSSGLPSGDVIRGEIVKRGDGAPLAAGDFGESGLGGKSAVSSKFVVVNDEAIFDGVVVSFDVAVFCKGVFCKLITWACSFILLAVFCFCSGPLLII